MTVAVDRIFTDDMAAHFIDKVKASAETKFGAIPIWMRSLRVGPTGKPYLLRKLGIRTTSGIWMARCNRAGAVYWSRPLSGEEFEVEQQPSPGLP